MDSEQTSKKYVIRYATIKDIPDLCKLAYEQFEREHLSEIGHTFSMATSFTGFEFSIKAQNRDVIVADSDGELVGYIVSIIDSPPYDYTMPIANECGLCTKAGWECNGIGWSLVSAMENAAIRRGVKDMSLGAPYMDWNEKKQASYSRRGYFPAEVICYKHVKHEGEQ